MPHRQETIFSRYTHRYCPLPTDLQPLPDNSMVYVMSNVLEIKLDKIGTRMTIAYLSL